jgi:hypothetical protein
LDRKVHLEEALILDIPEVAPLCNKLGAEKKRVSVGDCERYCEVEGQGVPMVLCHGGPGATHHVFHPYLSVAKPYFF